MFQCTSENVRVRVVFYASRFEYSIFDRNWMKIFEQIEASNAEFSSATKRKWSLAKYYDQSELCVTKKNDIFQFVIQSIWSNIVFQGVWAVKAQVNTTQWMREEHLSNLFELFHEQKRVNCGSVHVRNRRRTAWPSERNGKHTEIDWSTNR